MSSMQFIILVFLLAFATALTRFLPFFIFSDTNKIPPIVEYLGRVLPGAMMGLLVVYSFKDVSLSDIDELWPVIAASSSVVLIHLWKRNTILSVVVGTALYMFLIRL